MEEKSSVSLEMIDAVLGNDFFLDEENHSTTIHTPEQVIPSIPFENQEVLAEGTNNSQSKDLGFIVPIDSTGQVMMSTPEGGIVNKEKPSRWGTFSRAFILGITASIMVWAGMYFFQQANEFSLEQDNIVEANQLQQKETLTQQLIEARLNRLEQQVGEQLIVAENELEENSLQLGVTKFSSSVKKDSLKKSATTKGVDKLRTIKPITSSAINAVIVVGESENEIKDLLVIAEQRLKNKKLMYPEEESAYTAYQEVLSLSPRNQQALSGVNKIKETYLRWARYAIKKGKNESALISFGKALKVSPDDPDILMMLKKIQNAETTEVSKSEVPLKINLNKLLDDKEEGINKLLGIAKQQIIKKNLTTPEHSSAFAIYRAILDRFPMHKEAWSGIKKIKNKYINWARFEMKQGDLSHAKYLYTKALELAPADPEIIYALEQFK
jgi:tetratricopeptide (TPR) repeat protein